MSRVAQQVVMFVALAVFGIRCGPDSEQIRTYNLGARVQTGPLLYRAVETHWYLTLGSGPSARIPGNRFMTVRMKIANNGATDSVIPTFTLLDDKGQSYNELTDGTGVPNWLGVVRKITPMKSEDGNIVFDVAPQHFKLRVSDESDQIASYIDLPLNFVSDDRNP